MPRQRVIIYLDAEGVALLAQLAPSPRKKGQLVETLLRQAARCDEPLDVAGALARIERRLDRIERTLAATQVTAIPVA